ncbi:MAG TPA: transcription antitermination factor NusB [Bryobacteraceae bacterium]
MPVTGGLIRRISPARRAAFDVLLAVSDGAYASDTLRIRSRSLHSRDGGLAAQIVFGCLRYQSQLDYLIFFYSGRQAAALDLPVLLAMRMALFQLRYLERIPAHAAVHDSVELVKRHKRGAAGLVNAALRKVTRDPVKWPDRAVELSCPAWLLGRWEAHFGTDAARKIAAAALEEPVAYVRCAPGSLKPPDLELEPTPVAGAYRVLSPLPVGSRLHDIGSQAILPLLDLRPGSMYLDLCAAPGNKTVQALEVPLGLAIACDISWKRIRDIPPVCPRVVLDATQALPFRAPFDRIFIDAPCSGTGTLSRNPEIKWRVTDQDFSRFAHKQLEIVLQAAKLLAPAGMLLYATCSLEREENEDVMRRLLASRPCLEVQQEVWRLPGRDLGDGFYAAVLCAR